jgi:hypothetical protein
MSDHRRVWRDRERKHFRRVEKKRQQGKVQSVNSARIQDFTTPGVPDEDLLEVPGDEAGN